MTELPKKIQVIFDNNPQLGELIPRPTLISNTSFISALNQNLSRVRNSKDSEKFYRIIFKKDSSRELMTINSGELKGLYTSTCIKEGKISDVAGLKEIKLENQQTLMATLLGISLFSSINSRLSYISNLCVEIRNHQILKEQARFERISDTIVDCFNSVPDVALDKSMRDVYLSRIVKNNDDCYELIISQKEQLRNLFDSNLYHVSDAHYVSNELFFLKDKVLKHSLFPVFERLVAGKICEIVLSGNYSDRHIQRHKHFILRVMNRINEIFEKRLNDLDDYIENSEFPKNRYSPFAPRPDENIIIRKNLVSLLEDKLKSFDFLLQLMNQDEIDILLIDGNLVLNNPIIKE